ncbi:hypothetical protein HY629_00975 [Candidatus Uhrbacteria bacterium]|nr:hypothetical protein [Candidatus Uhrbacteria bacterium]
MQLFLDLPRHERRAIMRRPDLFFEAVLSGDAVFDKLYPMHPLEVRGRAWSWYDYELDEERILPYLVRVLQAKDEHRIREVAQRMAVKQLPMTPVSDADAESNHEQYVPQLRELANELGYTGPMFWRANRDLVWSDKISIPDSSIPPVGLNGLVVRMDDPIAEGSVHLCIPTLLPESLDVRAQQQLETLRRRLEQCGISIPCETFAPTALINAVVTTHVEWFETDPLQHMTRTFESFVSTPDSRMCIGGFFFEGTQPGNKIFTGFYDQWTHEKLGCVVCPWVDHCARREDERDESMFGRVHECEKRPRFRERERASLSGGRDVSSYEISWRTKLISRLYEARVRERDFAGRFPNLHRVIEQAVPESVRAQGDKAIVAFLGDYERPLCDGVDITVIPMGC